MNAIRAFWSFFAQRFPAARYVVYVVLWPAGILGALAPLHSRGTALGPSAPRQISAAAALFVVLFFMRAVDEIKDRDYDRRFNPDRPLVSGETDVPTVRSYLLWSAPLAVALGAAAGAAPAVAAALVMAYSLFLLWLEGRSQRFSDSMYGNIAITIQLKTGLICFVVLLSRVEFGRHVLPVALLVLAFLLAYLHWEIARKTIRSTFALPGEKLYSTARGAPWSLGLACVLMLLACALRAAATVWPGGGGGARLLPLLPLLVPLSLAAWNAVAFVRASESRYEPGRLALFSYVSFLAAAAAEPLLTGCSVHWFG